MRSQSMGEALFWLRVLVAVACLGPAPARAQIEPVKGGTRVDGIAAIVGGNAPGPGVSVLLHSDVELRARIHLAGQAPGPLPTGRLSEGLLRATLDELIGELLIAREAERVRLAEPEPDEVAREVARLERQAGGQDRLRRLVRLIGATEEEIAEIAARRATVQAFLHANLEGTTVVTDAEIDRAYEAGGHPFVGQPVDEVRDALRAWLATQALQRAVKRWVSVLWARTQVRVVAVYENPDDR